MKKLKTLLLGLALILSLSTFNANTFTARADGSQQGDDTTRKPPPPPCRPRCSIPQPDGSGTTPQAPASAATTAAQDVTETSDFALSEILYTVIAQLAAFR